MTEKLAQARKDLAANPSQARALYIQKLERERIKLQNLIKPTQVTGKLNEEPKDTEAQRGADGHPGLTENWEELDARTRPGYPGGDVLDW
jgi:hypothetical protein